MTRTELDNISVTLTNDDFWRLRHALVVASEHHQKARDRCVGQNQRSTDTILQHEHTLRRLEDVEQVLVAAFNAEPRTTQLTDREVAVLIDSLAFMRDHLEETVPNGAPNVRSALAKINSLMTPSTYGLRIEARDR